MTDTGVNHGGAGSDVFVSYASADAVVAKSIVENLEQQGLRCWMAPRDVKPGAPYAAAIVQGITEANALVVVLCASSIQSDHVAREVERAASKHKQIIAFRIDAAPLNAELEYFLSKSQWIDVPAWGMQAALKSLAEAVGTAPTYPEGAARIPAKSVGKSRRLAIAAAIVVGVGVAMAVGWHFWSYHSAAQPGATVAITDKSIAVLPFADMSEKKDQEYFADGMAEEILDQLVKIPGLTVIGRTSSFQFKGKNEDMRAIGTKLNAAYVLEGSVRKAGDQIRITAQLINTRTGGHEWSETYDRLIGDVLKLQDAIAAAVARELQFTAAAGQLNSRSTLTNADAYDLVLRGRHAADHWDPEDLAEAVSLFQQALDRDPGSADAAAGLAYTYEKIGAYGGSAGSLQMARDAATTALRLDSQNSLAHLVLGKVYMLNDWDWAAAERELKQAATLAPGSADPLIGQARLSTVLGRCEDALRQIKAALALDPLDPNSFEALWLIQVCRGHLPEAEAAIHRALDIRGTYILGHVFLGLTLIERRDHDGALLEMQKEPIEVAKQWGLVIAYYALGRNTDSDAALASWLKGNPPAYNVAQIYAFRNQSDETFHWLEGAYANKDAQLPYLKTDITLRRLATDARFKALLRKMHLPE